MSGNSRTHRNPLILSGQDLPYFSCPQISMSIQDSQLARQPNSFRALLLIKRSRSDNLTIYDGNHMLPIDSRSRW